MRLVEILRLTQTRIASSFAPRSPVAEFTGTVRVSIDEDAVRQMIRAAIHSSSKKSKHGPVHVQIYGSVVPRVQLPGMPDDDVFAGHEWATKPLP